MSLRTPRAIGLLLVSLILAPVTAFANGTISGVVIDGFTGQPVRGATLVIEGTDITLPTGVGGDFRGELPAGTYTVVVTSPGFESQKVTDVVVKDGGVADFAVVLLPASSTGELDTGPGPELVPENPPEPTGAAPDDTTIAAAPGAPATEGAQASTETNPAADSGVFMGEITVEATANDATEAALLAERRNAPMISDSIGKTEMAKNTGADAAQAVKRVTGVSLQEGKYVFVRGLGERYSNTQLNGSKIPSTEFDKKVVPFDLFPSNLLNKIEIAKSYTADKPGDFVAGLVEMDTLDFPATQTATVNFRAGYSGNATGKPFGQYVGGLDWSGNGGQPLPADFPEQPLVRRSPITGEGFTPEELEVYGQQLIGQWRALNGPTAYPWIEPGNDAPYATGLDLGYGATFGKFGLVLSGTHRHGYTGYSEEQNFYRPSSINESGVAVKNAYNLDFNNEFVKRSLVANFAYRFSPNHQVRLNTLLTSLANSETRYQYGYYDDFGSQIRDYKVDYRDQEITSFQLSGEHYLKVGRLGSLLEWRGAISDAATNQNMRMTNYADRADNGTFTLTDNAQSGFFYFNDLADTLDDYGVDWTTFISGDNSHGSIKFGLAYTDANRDFDGRRLRYQPRSTRGIDLTLPPEQIFTTENINPTGFEIEEITRPTDTYTGQQTVAAGYGMLDWSRDRWRVIAGLRYEDSQIDVVTLNRQNPDEPPIVTNLPGNDWMPSLGLVYRLTSDQNLRFSASETVNRPEFRELAPFQFTSITGGFELVGNPNLVSATIDSYDARWEWFPDPSSVIAAGVFYKQFQDPIETVLIPAVTITQTYLNADSARNQGLELEFRKSFQPFTVVLNYTHIDSQITLPEDTVQTNQQRALVGQPDNVGNVVLEWSNPRWSSMARLLYNYVGEQVQLAGAYGLPDVVEQPRSTLGFAFIQGFPLFGLDCNIKLSGENLTDSVWEYTQGGEIYRRWQPGRVFGFTFGLTFF
jgi:outer membrane receptor protein involved in Fe transport